MQIKKKHTSPSSSGLEAHHRFFKYFYWPSSTLKKNLENGSAMAHNPRKRTHQLGVKVADSTFF